MRVFEFLCETVMAMSLRERLRWTLMSFVAVSVFASAQALSISDINLDEATPLELLDYELEVSEIIGQMACN